MSDTPLVSIVIVNYSAGHMLRQCLESVRAQTYPNWEVVIIDNASRDDSLATVDGFPNLRVIRNQANLGFAAGQNQGINASRGQYIVALNYDIILHRDFLTALVGAVGQYPQVGWACGKLRQMTPEGELSERIYAAGHELPASRFAKLRGFGQRDQGIYDTDEYVFGAPGAAVVYRRSFIESLALDGGLFDEHLFTWYEDVDVDWRGQLAGWKCLYVPAALAYHVGHVGEDYDEPFRSFRAAMTIRNRWLVMAANETWRSFIKAMPGIVAYELSLVLYVLRVGLVRPYLQALGAFARSFRYVRRKRAHVHSRIAVS